MKRWKAVRDNIWLSAQVSIVTTSSPPLLSILSLHCTLWQLWIRWFRPWSTLTGKICWLPPSCGFWLWEGIICLEDYFGFRTKDISKYASFEIVANLRHLTFLYQYSPFHQPCQPFSVWQRCPQLPRLSCYLVDFSTSTTFYFHFTLPDFIMDLLAIIQKSFKVLFHSFSLGSITTTLDH